MSISNIQCSFVKTGNPHCFGAKKTSHKAALQPPGFGTQQGIQLPPASLRSKSGFHTYSSVLLPIQKLGKRPQENTEGFKKMKEKKWLMVQHVCIILLRMIHMDEYGKRPQENTEGFEKLKEKMAAQPECLTCLYYHIKDDSYG